MGVAKSAAAATGAASASRLRATVAIDPGAAAAQASIAGATNAPACRLAHRATPAPSNSAHPQRRA